MEKEDIDIEKTYSAFIENSIGTEMFRNLYVKQGDNGSTDVLNNGEYSCALYVSSLLSLLRLISAPHATVKSTVEDLESSGWEQTEEPKPGAVIVWEKQQFPGDNGPHSHIGFYIGEKKAVSTSYKTGKAEKHGWRFDGDREAAAFYAPPHIV